MPTKRKIFESSSFYLVDPVPEALVVFVVVYLVVLVALFVASFLGLVVALVY